ncbi:hypothetical protein V5O48_014475 [Marasmius crinis-equi]|uniref:Uncharacterized protein n=1 Tax=Marasmius crinis-equi TaxID=585013 RepID=A0ABR3EXH1_9AGAR
MSGYSLPPALQQALSTESIVIQPAATLSITFLFYGIYLTLFLLSVYILLSKRRAATRSAYPSSVHLLQTISLFVVTTIANTSFIAGCVWNLLLSNRVLETSRYEEYAQAMSGPWATTIRITFLVSTVLLNVIVDFILIKRCYLIWNSSKRVAYPLIFASVLLNLTGLAGIPFYGLGSLTWPSSSKWNRRSSPLILTFFLAGLLFNLVLTFMTAGRIWWISREAQLILLGRSVVKKYNTAVAIILESGAIFPVAQILNIVFILAFQPPRVMPFNPLPIVVTAASIAPTLVIVRVALGQSVEGVGVMVETQMKFEAVERNPVSLDLSSLESKDTEESKGDTSVSTITASV